MAHINKVLRSVETPDGDHCVDLFQRPDGTYGFEEYRRDVEDEGGWFPVGFYADEVYPSEDAALEKAMESVAWLRNVTGR